VTNPCNRRSEAHRLANAGVALRFTVRGIGFELDCTRTLRDGANLREDDQRVRAAVRYTF
jgi:hypothetical protein